MTVFSKVVTGVKRRTSTQQSATETSRSASSLDRPISPATSSSLSPSTAPSTVPARVVAPDLRRFSDFMKPFPAISPGGYTKYYQARAAAASSAESTHSSGSGRSGGSGRGSMTPSPYALPALCELNQRPPPGSSNSAAPSSSSSAQHHRDRARPPPIQTSDLHRRQGSSSSSVPSSRRSKKKAVIVASGGAGPHPLAPIPEVTPSDSARRSGRGATRSSGSSHQPRDGQSNSRSRGGEGASPDTRTASLDSSPTSQKELQGQGKGTGTDSPMASLRRKKRQLLRTPSIERDFAPHDTPEQGGSSAQGHSDSPDRHDGGRASPAEVKGSWYKSSTPSSPGRVATGQRKEKEKLGRVASVSSAQSSKSAKSSSSKTSSHSHRSTPSSSSSCGDSSMDSSHTTDVLLTPDSSIELDPATHLPAGFSSYYGPSAYSRHVHLGKESDRIVQGLGISGLGKSRDADWEPFERPDSRSTYRTARTHFDDI